MRKFYLLLSIGIFGLLIFPQITQAKTNVISVIGYEPNKQKFFNGNGKKVFSKKYDKKGDKIITPYAPFGRISSKKGLEWIIPYDIDAQNPERDKKALYIINQKNTKVIDSFHPFPKHNTARRVAAVGDLYKKYKGDEIVVCRSGASNPLIKIFNYSDKNGFKLIRKFRPYKKTSKNSRCCQSLAIGDVDGDLKNELIVASNRNKKSKIKIYNKKGKLKYSLKRWAFGQIHTGDIDGNGSEEIFYQGARGSIRGVNRFGTEIVKINSGYSSPDKKHVRSFTVSDVDNDGLDEIIYAFANKEFEINILNENYDIEKSFLAFPRAKKKDWYLEIFSGPFKY